MTTDQAKRERPILFSDALVRAILDGRKTQTRRIVKPQPKRYQHPDAPYWWYGADPGRTRDRWGLVMDEDVRRRMATEEAYGWGVGSGCPFGVPGERLWVREAFSCRTPGSYEDAPRIKRGCVIDFRATDALAESDRHVRGYSYRPSIHLPRWASRLSLDVTGVRVERVQDISEADIAAEGWPGPRADTSPEANRDAARDWWMDTWIAVYGQASWDANPWVWVIDFERVA